MLPVQFRDSQWFGVTGTLGIIYALTCVIKVSYDPLTIIATNRFILPLFVRQNTTSHSCISCCGIILSLMYE